MRKYRLFLYDSFNDWKEPDSTIDFKSFNNESALAFAVRLFKETEYYGFTLFEIFLKGEMIANEIACFPGYFEED